MNFNSWIYKQLHQESVSGIAPQAIEFDANGKPIIRVGGAGAKSGHVFKSLREFEAFKRKMGLRRVDVFDADAPINAMPRQGPMRYAAIEDVVIPSLRAANPRYGVIERWSVSNEAYADNIGEFIRDGKHFGLAVPDDDKTTVLRAFDKFTGKEIPSSEILADYVKAGGKLDASGNIAKRMRTLMNVEEFGMTGFAKQHKLGVFSTEEVVPKLPWIIQQMKGKNLSDAEAKGIYKAAVDGAMILNPELVEKLGKANIERAEELRRTAQQSLRTATDPKQITQLQNDIIDSRKLAETGQRMIGVAKSGGRLGSVRIGDYLIDEASEALGITPTMRKALQEGMIKGDAIVPSNWTSQLNQINSLFRSIIPGFKNFDPSIGGIFADDAVTKEMAMPKVGGYLTAAVHDATGTVRSDMQVLTAYGRDFDFDEVRKFNTNFFRTEFDEIRRTGSISDKYRMSLQHLADLETERLTGIQQADLMKYFGASDMVDLERKSARARRILGHLDRGVSLFENRSLMREVTDSMIDLVRPDGLTPRFLMPGAVRGTVTSGTWAKFGGLIGMKEALAEGETLYRGSGAIYSDMAIYNLSASKGGWDLDDAVAMHMRYFRGSKTMKAGIYSLDYRAPMALGEESMGRVPLDRADDAVWGVLSEVNDNIRVAFGDNGRISIPGSRGKPDSNVAINRALEIEQNMQSAIDRHTRELQDIEAKKAHVSGKQKRNLERQANRKRRAIGNLDDQVRQIRQQIDMGKKAVLDRPDLYFPDVSEEKLASAAETARAAKSASLDHATGGWGTFWSNKRLGADFVDEPDTKAMGRIGKLMSEYVTDPDADEIRMLNALVSGAADSTDLTEGFYRQMIEKGNQSGILGRYSNVRAMTDETIKMMMQMEAEGKAVPDHLKGIFKLTEQEDIIDLMVQNKGQSLDFTEVERRTMGMVDALAQVTASGEVKLDPKLFDDRMRAQRDAFATALEEVQKDMGIDPMSRLHMSDVFLDLNNADELHYAQYAQALMVNQEIVGEAEAMRAGLLDESINIRKEIASYTFEPEEYKRADEIEGLLKAARDEWEDHAAKIERDLISDPNYAGVMKPDTMERFRSRYMSERFTQALDPYFEGTSGSGSRILNKEGHRIYGAFMQRHGGQYGYLASAGDMAAVSTQIEDNIIHYIGRSQNVPRPIKRTRLRTLMPDQAAMPGAGKQALADAVADVSARTAGPGRASGLKSVLKKIAGLDTIKKGAAGAGAIIAASFLYQSINDRSEEDLQGMPGMPGGNYYGYDIPMPADNMGTRYVSSGSEPGISYRVNAFGNYDPAALAATVGGVTGVEPTGRIYSRQQFNPNKEFSIIDEAF